MCGIAGAVGLTAEARPDPMRVRAMCDRIAHRGPDGEGVWVSPSGRACLGHRRLSVIDLATGQQPMVEDDGRFGLVFNGEIYNYVELREAMAAGGESFRTTSDTEVLLRLLRREGKACLDRLRGMFAFVAFDDTTGELIIARDRIGKKPLYWLVEDGILYFASSLSALRASTRRGWEVDPASLDRYLTLGYVPAPGTIFRDVGKLAAGSVGDGRGGRLNLTRFFDLGPARSPYAGSYRQALDRLHGLVDEAVTIRLRSDVPVGVYLSGGIDSSLVAAIAARRTQSAIETFSIAFDESEFDESAAAASLADRLGLRRHVFRVGSDIVGSLPEMVAHFGEPHADWSALPMWALARETRRHVTVAIGGDGGDEGFAGYNWYGTARDLARRGGWVPAGAARVASDLLRPFQAGSLPSLGRIERGLRVLGTGDAADRFAALRSLLGSRDRLALYSERFRASLAGSPEPTAALAGIYRDAEGAPLRRMRCVDAASYLADDLMPKVDVTSMAFGLEVRAPLLDHEVVSFGLSLPDEYLIDDRGGKRILKDLLAETVPDFRVAPGKRGFTPPVSRWFAGPLAARLRALPDAPGLSALGATRPDGVRALVDEHLSGGRDHGARLFALLILEEWALQHMDVLQPGMPGTTTVASAA